VEFRGSFAGAQERLSGGDLDDERIGGSRSRRDIAQFFAGDVAAPYIDAGVFRPTGETLAQIQSRVLPGVVNETQRIPLYSRTGGWVAFDAIGGVRVSEYTTVGLAVTNLLDRNYRVHGSGIDGPGVGVSVRLKFAF
jgi:outer membrane receptor protein involved in Fe transport